SNPGTVTIDGRTIHYAGLDPYLQFDATNPSHIVINGSALNDSIVVEDAHPGSDDGEVQVTVGSNSYVFSLVPSGVPGDSLPSLTINGGAGGDTITVRSFHPLFATNLLIYGNQGGQPTAEPDVAHDIVEFQGDVYTHGGRLEAFGDNIIVDPGAT